jgi:hypothetical protein
LEICAKECAICEVGNASMLLKSLDRILPDQSTGCVAAYGAIDARKRYETIAAFDAAVISPLRKCAEPRKPSTAGTIARNETFRGSRRFGRTPWRRWCGHHRRSRIETKMNCGNLLGQVCPPSALTVRSPTSKSKLLC